MYLGEQLTTDDGTFPMCGALPISTEMRERVSALGYREVTTSRATPLGPAGTVFRGHEFRYSGLASQPELASAYRVSGYGKETDEGWLKGNTLGSYVHAHWRSNPAIAAAFVQSAAEASR